MTMHPLISICVALLAGLAFSAKIVDAQFPICYICGDPDATFNPDIVLEEPVTCEQVQEIGLAGEIDELDCTALEEEFNVPELCECSNVDAPVPAPVPVPVPVPVPAPVPFSTPSVPVPVKSPILPMNNTQVTGMGMMGMMGMGMGNMGGMGMMELQRHVRN